MESGINKEYDELRNRLLELRMKVQLLGCGKNNKEEIEKLLSEINVCRHRMSQIERDKLKK